MITLTLIKNEIIKILARKKSLVTTVAFILLIAVLGFGMYKESANSKKYNSPAYKIEQEKSRIEYLKNSKEPNAQEEIKQSEERNGEPKAGWCPQQKSISSPARFNTSSSMKRQLFPRFKERVFSRWKGVLTVSTEKQMESLSAESSLME